MSILTIPQGTTALDEGGKPLKSVSISSTQLGGTIYACNLGPNGATFDPEIILKITFDPPDDVEEDGTVIIKMWGGAEWISLETTVDITTNTATAKASHFSVFALFDEETQVMRYETTDYTPSATVTATPVPIDETPVISQPAEETPVIPWMWLMLTVLIAGLIVIWAAYNKR